MFSNKSNKDTCEQGLDMTHQILHSDFHMLMLCLHNKQSGEEKNPCLAFSLLAVACILMILMKLISSSALTRVHCLLVASSRAAAEAQCQSLQICESQRCLNLFPTLWIPLVSDPKRYYTLTCRGRGNGTCPICFIKKKINF